MVLSPSLGRSPQRLSGAAAGPSPEDWVAWQGLSSPTVAKDAPRNVGSGTLCSRWGQLLGVSRAALELTRTWLQLSRFEATNRTPLGAHPALSEPSAVSNGDAGKAEPRA